MDQTHFKRHFKVFISSPAQVSEERRIAEEVIRQHNFSTLAKEYNYHLDAMAYEANTVASSGDPQTVVDVQMGEASDFDLFICILWSKMGTQRTDKRTGIAYPSGTAYEFAQAVEAYAKNGRPEIMLYRCTKPAPPNADLGEIQQVTDFFNNVNAKKLALYKEYHGDFRSLLTQELNEKAQNWIVRVRLKQPVTNNFRGRMLSLVEHFWLAGSDSDPNLVQLTLTDPNANPPASFVFEGGQQLYRRFMECNCQLVMLGGPASGKTFVTLQLLEVCLASARGDLQHPIPVVLYATSWMEKRGPMEAWIIDELQKFYNLRRRGKDSAEWLVENRELMLIIDGLNEINPELRPEFVSHFNAYLARHDTLRFIITCQSETYFDLTELIKSGQQAVACLQVEPLSTGAIDAYLQKADLSILRNACANNPLLRELAQTAFLLVTMGVAYRDGARGVSVEAINRPRTKEEHLKTILGSYVEGQLKEETTHVFSTKKTEQALSWLAHRMENRRSAFLVEQMQPDLMEREHQPKTDMTYVLWSGLILAAFVLLVVGLPTSAAIGYEWTAWHQDHWNGLARGLFVGSFSGCAGAAIIFIGYCLTPNWTFAAFIGLAAGAARGTCIALSINDNGTGLMGFSRGVKDGQMTAGFAFLIFLCLLINRQYSREVIKPLEVIQGNWRSRWKKGLLGIPVGLLIAISFGLARDWGRGLGFGIAIGTMVGMLVIFSGVPLPARVRPNQGIRQSARHALRIGLLLTVIGMISFGSAYGISEPHGRIAGIVNALLGAVLFIIALFFGGLPVIQHYGLRLALWCKNHLPLRLVKFLNYAAERKLLRKRGGSYEFLNEYLRDYFKQRPG